MIANNMQKKEKIDAEKKGQSLCCTSEFRCICLETAQIRIRQIRFAAS